MTRQEVEVLQAGNMVRCLNDTASFGKLRAGSVYVCAEQDGYGVRLIGVKDSHMAERFELVKSPEAT